MNYRIVTAALLLLVPTALPVAAQTPRKPTAPKPPAKPTPTAPGGKQTIVLGTKQLPGDFGQFGQTYTIGALDRNATNFTLDRAEYSVAPFIAGKESVIPTAEEKLLVLHFTVHNPNPAEQHVDWGIVTFTAVDAKDVNHEGEEYAVREGTRDESVVLDLKPAQKLALTAVIKVPAQGVAPKLIVHRDSESAVIRYDLRGKVASLPAPFADPADASGATARNEIPAEAGTFYAMGAFEARLDSVALSDDAIQGQTPEEGGRFLTAVFTLRNPQGVELHYDWGSLLPMLTDTDGDKYEYNQLMLKATKDEELIGDLKLGEEVRVRYFFAVPKNGSVKSLRVANGSEGRTFVFDVSGAK